MTLRSLLFVPGDSDRKLQKAVTVPADAVICDLEDAVVPAAGLQAIDTITLDLRDPEALVRDVQRARR